MKKIICLFIISTMFAVLLTGCNIASTGINTDKLEVGNEVEGDDNAPIEYDFKSDDFVAMSVHHAGGEFAVGNDMIYGRGYKNGHGVLMAISQNLENKKVIADVTASNLILKDDEIYFIDISQDGVSGNISKINTDGSEWDSILDANAFTLQLFNDKFYFTEIESGVYNFYSCNLDGSDKDPILQGNVFYPYVIDDRIIYQNDNDNETLHIYKLSDESDERITNTVSYNPVYNGEYIYYVAKENENMYLARINPDGGKEEIFKDIPLKTAEIFASSYKLYYYSDENGKTLTYADISEDKPKLSGENLANSMTYKYIDSKFNILMKNTEEGVKNIVITNLKTGQKLEYLN